MDYTNWLPLRILFFLLLAAAPTGVLAQWSMMETTYRGAPAYSLVSNLDADHYLRLSCYGPNREIVLTDRDGQGPSVFPDSVDYVWMELQSDTGRTWNSPADFATQTDGSLGLFYRTATDMRAIVEDIVAARDGIRVSMIHAVMGTEDRYVANAKGSTKAGREFLDKCFGADGGLSTPELSLSAWDVRTESDPATGEMTAIVTGDLSGGGRLDARCGNDHQPILVLLGSPSERLPFEAGDVGLMMHLDVDGRDLSAVGEFFTGEGGRDGIRFAAGDNLQGVLTQLGGAASSVAVRVQSYATGVDVSWPAKNLQGLALAITEFNRTCLGEAAVAADVPATEPPDAQWSFAENALLFGTEYVLYATTDDGRSTLVFSCDTDGSRAIALRTRERELFPVTARSLDILLEVGAGDRNFRLPASFDDTSPGLIEVRSTSSVDLKEIVVRIANGESPLGAAVTNQTSGSQYLSMIGGPGAQAAARQFAMMCLTEEERFKLAEEKPFAVPPGWQLMDGAAADLRSYSRVIVHAPTTPPAGKVEISCYAESNARSIAFYSDDYGWGDKVAKAVQIEMAVFVDDRFWSIANAGLIAAAAEIGIGGTDQGQLSEILAALAASPGQVTVSTRLDFGEWEPHAIDVSNVAAVSAFLAACPR